MKKPIIGIAILVLLASCGENKKSTETVIEDVVTVDEHEHKHEHKHKEGKMSLMKKSTSVPHYMKMTLKNKKELGITNAQEIELERIKKDKKPQGARMAKEIDALEKEIYLMSLNNSSQEKLLIQLEKSLAVRKEVAGVKTDCRNELIEVLTEEQWNKLTTIYKEQMPFDTSKGMMELMTQASPVPNYMRIIMQKEIALEKEQDSNVKAWQNDHHAQVSALVKEVNTLQHKLYNLSLEKGSKESILKIVDEIAKTKTAIVTTKTECRDYLFSFLSEEQKEKITQTN